VSTKFGVGITPLAWLLALCLRKNSVESPVCLDVKTVHPEASTAVQRLEPDAATWDPVGVSTNAADLGKSM